MGAVEQFRKPKLVHVSRLLQASALRLKQRHGYDQELFDNRLSQFIKGHIYSFINLSGLAIGLASVMLIIAYIGYELSFDRHFPNSDRIFQLVMESRAAGRTVQTPDALGKN